MLSVNYPLKYQDEQSRIGKKFKYYRVEPIDIESKRKEEEDKPKEIKIGKRSGRIATIENYHRNQLNESIFAESFSDIVDNYLEELNKNENNSKYTQLTEEHSRTDTD